MKTRKKPFHISTSLVLFAFILFGCTASPPAETELPVEIDAVNEPAAVEEVTESEPVLSPAEMAASLEGLPIDEFFYESFRLLMLRDPEAITNEGIEELLDAPTGQLNNLSDDYIRDTQALEIEILDLLSSYDRASLAPEQQTSYDVYTWYLEDLIAAHDFIYNDYPASHFLTTSVQTTIFLFFTDTHPLDTEQDAQAYIARLNQVGTQFDQIIEGLELRSEAGIIPPRFSIQWAYGSMQGMAGSSYSASPFYATFRDKLDEIDDLDEATKEQLLSEAQVAVTDSVIPAYQRLSTALRQLESSAPTDDGVWQFENGTDYYNYLLRHQTTTDLSADEIHELGLQELDRIHAEMRVLFDQLGYSQEADLQTLYAQVASDGGFISGNQIVETHENIIVETTARLDQAFEILPEAEVIVIGGSFGGFYIPASLDGTRPGAFYAQAGGNPEPWHTIPTLNYHEAIPGHHLQIALAQEMDLPLFRNIIGINAYVEGWALYAERLASELGWYEDDVYGDLGRLQFEAFRAARLVVDTGIHAQGWTFDEATAFFSENIGFDEQMSQQQIARYVVLPGQSTSYMVGMLKILELRQVAMDQLGDQFDLKEFHTVILSSGSVPLDLLEDIVNQYIADKLAGS
ncbi:MAG: DUF885 domain-containing protein [Chloroflexi bacterium]|nr:MAG: DUF885 domain-containing protein [Chloroflexota bacterium]MBL1195676.1 DUF885 domain-containing protein [Chloroflexota bacterium]NOH12964.1 DUF885 domain-containing protein [Chloroflexota bacterium]